MIQKALGNHRFLIGNGCYPIKFTCEWFNSVELCTNSLPPGHGAMIQNDTNYILQFYDVHINNDTNNWTCPPPVHRVLMYCDDGTDCICIVINLCFCHLAKP